jgi:hypothetical protein
MDREAVENYLRQDLAEMDNPHRQDRDVLLKDVATSARLYYADWISVLQKPGEDPDLARTA